MKRASAILAVVICGLLGWTACSTAWTTEAEQIVAVMIPAATNLMTLIGMLRGNVSSADLQTIQSAGTQAAGDLQLIQSLISQYEKADAAAQPGLANQISAALAEVQLNLGGILPALHIKDAATQGKVEAIVGLVLTEVQSMAAIVPLVSSAHPQTARLAASVVKKQAPLSASQFVSSYNATMTAKTGNPELDRSTAGLRIRAHGTLERWVSAELAK